MGPSYSSSRTCRSSFFPSSLQEHNKLCLTWTNYMYLGKFSAVSADCRSKFSKNVCKFCVSDIHHPSTVSHSWIQRNFNPSVTVGPKLSWLTIGGLSSSRSILSQSVGEYPAVYTGHLTPKPCYFSIPTPAVIITPLPLSGRRVSRGILWGIW